MRLQKYMAECGVASRRKCEEIIAQGRVSVNGSIVSEMGVQVEDGDEVLVDGKPVKPEKRRQYILLNKPQGVVTTLSDPQGRKTVRDLITDIPERIYPVGRLDYETEGLLILTNDGELMQGITHPSREVEKLYVARVARAADRAGAGAAGMRPDAGRRPPHGSGTRRIAARRPEVRGADQPDHHGARGAQPAGAPDVPGRGRAGDVSAAGAHRQPVAGQSLKARPVAASERGRGGVPQAAGGREPR